MIPNAGQVANMDNPDAFNRLMMDFLAARYPAQDDEHASRDA